MEKYLKDLKTIIKFLLYGIVLVIVLDVVVSAVLQMIRLTLIPTSWVITIVLVIIFRKRILGFIKKLFTMGGTQDEEK